MRRVIAAATLACLFASPLAAEPAPATDGTALGVTDDARCQLLANVASQLGGPVIGGVEGIQDQHIALDCSTAFTAAGLHVVPGDRDARGWDDRHAWHFSLPQYLDAKNAVVSAADECPLCGHGEIVTVTLEGDSWKITGRQTGWMS